jgi:hypothetical protein
VTLIEYRSGLISLISLDARRAFTGTVLRRLPAPFLIGAPITPTQRRRGANQTADRAPEQSGARSLSPSLDVVLAITEAVVRFALDLGVGGIVMQDIMIRIETDDFEAWKTQHYLHADNRAAFGIIDGPAYQDIDRAVDPEVGRGVPSCSRSPDCERRSTDGQPTRRSSPTWPGPPSAFSRLRTCGQPCWQV